MSETQPTKVMEQSFQKRDEALRMATQIIADPERALDNPPGLQSTISTVVANRLVPGVTK